MTDFYLDHGAYGSSNRIGLDNPTWGVPQEGDGTLTSAATAAGVAEIKINAVPTASETLTIAGAVITAAATSGTNAFVRGATPADTATNIVTLINSLNFQATVGTSVANNTGIGPTANQGRNMMYARVKPGATDTVQIMWRIGSTALDYANNSNVAISSSGWGTPPTITQFTGGTSGCFGYFINPVAYGQGSSITANQYGIMMARPTVVKSGVSSVYALTYSDPVWVRSGAGYTIATTFASGQFNRVSGANDLYLILDSNTKWTGDSGTGTFALNITTTSGNPTTWGINQANSRLKLDCLVPEALQIRDVSTISGASLIIQALGIVYETGPVLFEEDAAVPSTSSFFPHPSASSNALTIRHNNTVFSFQRPQSTGRSLTNQYIGGSGSAGNYREIEFNNCEVRQNYSGSSNPTAAVLPVSSSVAASARCIWRGGKITGIGSYRQPIYAGSFPASATIFFWLSAENCKGSDIPGSGIAPWTAYGGGQIDDLRYVYQSTAESGRSFRYENIAGCADWLSNAATPYPLLNGRMLDGTQYSVRALWLYGTGQDITRGFKVLPFKQTSRGTTGTKTFTQEMFLPTAVGTALTRTNFELMLQYVDNSGNVITETKTGANVVTSAASWTNAGSYGSNAAYKISFTTSNQVAQYCEVSVQIKLKGDSPSGAAADCYLDPGFTLT